MVSKYPIVLNSPHHSKGIFFLIELKISFPHLNETSKFFTENLINNVETNYLLVRDGHLWRKI